MFHFNAMSKKWQTIWIIVCFCMFRYNERILHVKFVYRKKYINYVLYIVVFALILCLCCTANRNEKLFKIAVYSTILTFITYCIYFILSKFGFLRNISISTIKEVIKSFGAGGVFAFLGITILQVIVLPIPSAITILAGSLIYGPTLTFLISTLGIIIGSLIAFILGRVLGKRIIFALFSREKVSKYSSYLGNNGGWILFFDASLAIFSR